MGLTSPDQRETLPHDPVPDDVRAQIRGVLERCKLYPFLGGWGTLITDSEQDAQTLRDGWLVGHDEYQQPIVVRCARQTTFVYAPGGKTFAEIWMAPAMVVIAREIRDERKRADVPAAGETTDG